MGSLIDEVSVLARQALGTAAQVRLYRYPGHEETLWCADVTTRAHGDFCKRSNVHGLGDNVNAALEDLLEVLREKVES